MAYYGLTDTVFGSMLIAVDGERTIALKFGVDEARMASVVEELHRELRGAFALERSEAKIKPVAAKVQDYLSGKRSTLDLEFDVSWIDGFRRDVLLECARIPRGQVATYAELARRVGRPNAYRAVGNTMRTNPIPILIPCHRVVGSNGSLTGFGGGLDMKQKLLQLEGARPQPLHGESSTGLLSTASLRRPPLSHKGRGNYCDLQLTSDDSLLTTSGYSPRRRYRPGVRAAGLGVV